jgi:hypothetical protein
MKKNFSFVLPWNFVPSTGNVVNVNLLSSLNQAHVSVSSQKRAWHTYLHLMEVEKSHSRTNAGGLKMIVFMTLGVRLQH